MIDISIDIPIVKQGKRSPNIIPVNTIGALMDDTIVIMDDFVVLMDDVGYSYEGLTLDVGIRDNSDTIALGVSSANARLKTNKPDNIGVSLSKDIPRLKANNNDRYLQLNVT